jgi:hypothetical protein
MHAEKNLREEDNINHTNTMVLSNVVKWFCSLLRGLFLASTMQHAMNKLRTIKWNKAMQL